MNQTNVNTQTKSALDTEIDNILKEGLHDDLSHSRHKLAEGTECPLCLKKGVDISGSMKKKKGPYGEFLSCTNYPACKFTWSNRN